MKPISVRFQCFGPYMAEQFIDFAELEKNGLFLICGETGAGKTTILDAMCYALYGRSSGGLRGDLSVMRCKLAQQKDETLVEFVFDCGGKRYLFTRSLKYGRKKLNDSHNCLVWEDGVYVPIFENPKATVVNKKAEELIGLSYEQFRQVIILPQGQFEKLLVSDSVEKEKILVSLFHADRWQKIAEELYRRVSLQDSQLKQEKLQIAGKLAEYGCKDLSQLEEKQVWQEQQLEKTRQEHTDARKQLEVCRQRSDAAILENRAFEELRQWERTLAALQSREELYREEELLLKDADAAERIRPEYLAWQEAKRQKLRGEGLMQQSTAALELARQKQETLQQTWQNHLEGRKAQEERSQRILLLENAAALYRSLQEKAAALDKARALMDRAVKEAEKAERFFGEKDGTWQRSLQEQNRAMESYRQAQSIYLQGIGSTLAQNLLAGQPCPVCGSLEHPSPAKPQEGHVTEGQLEEKNQAMNRANEVVSLAMEQRSRAEKTRSEAVSALHRAQQEEMLARAEYENALSCRIDGIADEKQLEQTMKKLTNQLQEYQREDERLSRQMTEAEVGVTAARARLETVREELAAVQTAYAAQCLSWEQALAGSGLETEAVFQKADLPTEERQRRKTALLEFRTDLEHARKQLAEKRQATQGREAPDMAAIRSALAGAEKLWKELTARQALEENRLSVLEKDRADLEKRTLALDEQRQKVDADLDFANRLRGRSGVSLQRYVLGVMLTSITAAANQLLKNVCGGRYRLYRTDEIAGSGHKGGLELEVYDSQNNQRRSVTTLSGGEKFLVALSLAIGLSTVVQAQGGGIRLEAMFIDEGFGSLDTDAVNDALEVLQGIQRTSGVVGIISHVEQLAQTIPTRLEIKKGRNGSVCQIHG